MTTEVSEACIVHQDPDQHRNGCRNRSQRDGQKLRVVQHCLNTSTETRREFSIYYRSTNVYNAAPAWMLKYCLPLT